MNKRMRSLVAGVASALFALGSGGFAWAVETGDFDGDGRITIADVVHLQRDRPAADGSLEGLDEFACAGLWSFPKQERSGLTYLEVLRRAVDDPMPQWIPVWTEATRGDPLPPDERVLIYWAGDPRVDEGQDRADIQFFLRNTVPVQAFSLLVESADQVLRVAPLYAAFRPPGDWDLLYSHTHANTHGDGDVNIGVGYPPFLVTRGRIVMNYGLDLQSAPFPGPLEPGEHWLVAEVRVPRGTPAGRYPLEVLPTSQVLLEDGTVVAPAIESANDLVVETEVGTGWDGGIPPLQIDPAARRVSGPVEFRVIGDEGFPGDAVTVRVQMRTERPLNHVTAKITWPAGELICLPEEPTILFTNPQDGRLYEPYRASYCTDGVFSEAPAHQVEFTLQGAKAGNPNYRSRPLEYFRPVGEWTDLTEVRLRIPEGAGGGTEVPLTVVTPWQEGKVRLGQPIPQYLPYARSWPCFPPEFEERLWTHEEPVLHHGTIVVQGDDDPDPDPEPPDIGMRWALADGNAAPGDVVDIPVLAAVREPPFAFLRLVLEVDPEAVSIESFDYEVLSLKSGQLEPQRVERGGFEFFQECEVPEDPESCTYGVPFAVRFHDTSERYAVIDVTASTPDAVVEDYPGTSLSEVGVLRVRLREDYEGSRTTLAGGVVPAGDSVFDADATSGAFLPPPDYGFSPAAEVQEAVITVSGNEARFVRGDGNSDGAIDLSDAVAILSYLFLGTGTPSCLDANDVDDNGRVEVTDAIALLGRLFLGAGPLDPPYPECGPDPTEDDLDCVQSACNVSP